MSHSGSGTNISRTLPEKTKGKITDKFSGFFLATPCLPMKFPEIAAKFSGVKKVIGAIFPRP